ncbi:hypothetical protein [Rhodococcus baikonurensis]|uniref:Uncharacterized protein n=1 Tax=Rhodococcus baikonurensis TaxID=172041 RepID=A0ABV5XTF6_9NOCA
MAFAIPTLTDEQQEALTYWEEQAGEEGDWFISPVGNDGIVEAIMLDDGVQWAIDIGPDGSGVKKTRQITTWWDEGVEF